MTILYTELDISRIVLYHEYTITKHADINNKSVLLYTLYSTPTRYYGTL